MHRRTPLLVLPLLFLAAAPLAAAEPDNGFFFRKGDRIIFLGDSITEQFQYSTDIELYLTTRFPGWDLTFLNAGIGGDTATGGARRFQNHVLAERPTCLTIDFGMNDGGYGGFDPARAAAYVQNTEAMLEAANKAGVRVALLSPNAVEVRARPNLETYLETQAKFYAPLRDLAARFQVPFVDQYAVTRQALEKLAADKAPVSPFPDGVHTNGPGGLLMAHTILVGLHAPALVSDLEIDAGSKTAKPKNCTADELDASTDRVSFVRKDAALPLPVPGDWRPVLPYVNDLKDLNYYGLKVTGLGKGKYTLAIDGRDVDSFTADELAAGVNLGNLGKGPLFEQGQEVFRAINEKNRVVHGRFRGVVMYDVNNAPDWLRDVAGERKAVELQNRKEKIDALQAEVYRKAQPGRHRFELKAAR
jgi:lysophospholipase L1-like esterase